MLPNMSDFIGSTVDDSACQSPSVAQSSMELTIPPSASQVKRNSEATSELGRSPHCYSAAYSQAFTNIHVLVITEFTGNNSGRPCDIPPRLKLPRFRREYLAIMNMVTIFAMMCICWMPMVGLYAMDIHGLVRATVYKAIFTLPFINSAINVLLYTFMNQSYRRAHRKLIQRCFSCRH